MSDHLATLDFLKRLEVQAIRGNVGGTRSDGYEGGKVNRRTHGWRPTLRSADSHINQDWLLLTARGEWLRRNNPLCRRGAKVLTDNVIGQGVQTRATVKDSQGQLLKDWNRRADDFYRAAIEEMDRADRSHFHQMNRTAFLSAVGSGEVLYIIRNDAEGFNSGRRMLPLSFELVSGAQFDDTMDRVGDPPRGVNEIRRGVERDANGKRVAYHLYTQHPGALYPTRIYQSERVEADRVIHLYSMEDLDQVRGVTWYAPIVSELWNLYEYERSEIDAAKVASYFIFMWKKEHMSDGNAFGFEDEETSKLDLWNNTIAPLQPGIGLEGGPQDDLQVVQSSRPSSQAVPWLKLMLQILSAGFHCGYSKFTGDFTSKNFSGQRAEDLNDNRGFAPIRAWHNWYLDLFVRKLATRQAIGLGLLPIPVGGVAAFNRNPRRWLSCRAIPHAEGYVNPREEVAASIDRIKGGLSCFEDELGAQGRTLEVHERLAEELGISLEEYQEKLRESLLSGKQQLGQGAVGKGMKKSASSNGAQRNGQGSP